MKHIISQPQKEQLAKRFYRFLYAPYINYYNLRSANRTGHELAAAMSVAKDLYHFREWLPEPLNNLDTVFRACPEYAVLRDIVNVDKHYHKNKPNKHGPTFLFSKDDIHEVDIVTWYKDEQGDYLNHQQAILLLLHAGPKPGFRRDILMALTNVINYWIDVLHKERIIRESSHFPFVEVSYVSRENAKVNHSILSDTYPHEVEVIHMVYNPHDNTLSPIDPNVQRLTGYKIEWDAETGEGSIKARFAPDDSAEGWTLSMEDADGNQYSPTLKPITFKIGPY